MGKERKIGKVSRFLRGVIAPMYTPVHRDGALDLEGAGAMVDWLASTRSVDCVFARSGMGRMFTFTLEETRQFGAVVREATRGRMGLLLGTAGEWLDREQGGRPDPAKYTAQAVELTRYAAEICCEGVVHILPEALVRPEAPEAEANETILAYYNAVHDAADLPLVLYQPAGLQANCRLSPGLLACLLRMPRIVGAKVSTTDDAVFSPLAQAAEGTGFSLIVGHEGYYLRGLCQGATGVIGQGCNGYPEVLRAVGDRWQAGDLEGAARAQADIEKGLKITQGLHSGVALKQYITAKGFAVQAWDRGGEAPYPAPVIGRLERDLDALRDPYRLRAKED